MSLPLRTRLFAAFVDRLEGPRLRDRTPAQIEAGRRRQPPHRFPFDRLFGAVPSDVRHRDDLAVTRAGSVRVRFYESSRHHRPVPLVVYLHGGGWVQGSVPGYDAVCGQVASRTGALVMSVGYRLAPEHRFPAAVEDCYDALVWAVSRADVLGVDPDRVAVMGDSAGGNLAAVVSQLARDLTGPALAAQVLIYPAVDATLASPSIDRLADAPFLNRNDIVDFLDAYHPDADRTDPLLSPLLAADLRGLPRALVQTAEYDPLVDDGRRYAQALASAGVPVRYTEYADSPHGFVTLPGLVACRYQPLHEITAELRDVFGTAEAARTTEVGR